MSRWGKNIVVPLDVLCKGEENTNRSLVNRSVGTVGKWGKIGFTSTRTYALAAMSPAVVAAAAAAAAAASPSQSPPSLIEDDMSPSVPEPPKPKKFFKSRNAAPPEVIAQMMQNMPRTPASPMRENHIAGTSSAGSLNTPVREPIKLKLPKSNSGERKKKSSKKTSSKNSSAEEKGTSDNTPTIKPASEPKQKKKKEEKKLKPEAPPSRVISRARKIVNYCEDDEDERIPTPLKDIIYPKVKPTVTEEEEAVPIDKEDHVKEIAMMEPDLPPPAAPAPTSVASCSTIVSNVSTTITVATALAPKTPEHPPIVLRISKGTSRLVSTDSEEQPANNVASPHQRLDTEPSKSRHTSTEEVPPAYTPTVYNTPKIIVKPPRPPTPDPVLPPPPLPHHHHHHHHHHNTEDPPEINYSTVKISPDKPPKERLKLIIKTDVIRNAIKAAEAAKAAAAAQKAAALAESGVTGGEREKKQKSKKHKHLKHAALEQLSSTLHANITATGGSEFKTPSPHLAFNVHLDQQQHQQQPALLGRTVISPPALSERDFDSQSSVLGSISSKGNSTPQLLTQAVQEESCVIHSRGSSVITSDLETSQHSSLVAPPSDIELRLESMMMDGEASQRATNIVEEPLQEDILAVLRGDESLLSTAPTANKDNTNEPKLNGITEQMDIELQENITEHQRDAAQEVSTNRRMTRGRGRGARTDYAEDEEVKTSPQKVQPLTISRNRAKKLAPTVAAAIANEEILTTPATKRTTRGRPKKGSTAATNEEPITTSADTDESPAKASTETAIVPTTDVATNNQANDTIVTPAIATAPVTRRGRLTRNVSNNNNINNNNYNINKIAASLSAKAGAAEEAAASANKSGVASTSPLTGSTPTAPRSYGRKRKNQQVTQVLQPSADELEEQKHGSTPAKQANIDYIDTAVPSDLNTCASPLISAQMQNNSITPTIDLHDTNSNSNSITRPDSATPSSPPRRDYKVKDKFKRTLTLDNQANCNAVVESPTAGLLAEHVVYGVTSSEVSKGANGEDDQHRGSVKLVISKKKGSIFKSRTLVPTDHTEHTTASKRHLYKHSWDAEANGSTEDNTNALPLQGNETVAPPAVNRTAADAIFDDFSEDLSPSAISRDTSPAMGKLTRVTRTNNVQTHTNSPYDMDIDTPNEPITSVKVDRKAKGFYTVVRNVKTAHQIQEIGEYQEMDDDVEYILDALQPHNPTPTRCLSALQLASKCMIPTFRMHVRAHGVVTKFFKALSDANLDQSLGLCTSAIMFILSQEGLNMDLDRDSLELMMNLLESEIVAAPSDRANYERNRQKVRELCEEIKSQGKATHLNVDTLTVGTLAMETLLSLTSKRAGEWFKEELRSLGGLEHIIKTISDNCRPVIECSNGATHIHWAQSLLDNMQTVERCMRVLENVTQLNEENQRYVLTYGGGATVHTLCSLFTLCDREIMRHVSESSEGTAKDNPGVVMRELLFPLLKVLINLTHTFNPANAVGAEMLGQRSSVIETSFRLLLQAPNYIPERFIFELSILVLLLLINLTMYTIPNRVAIMKVYAPPEYSSHQHNKVTAVQAVMEYFYRCEELARLVEKNTDAILDSTDKNKKKQEEVDETVNNLLKNSGHHMEHTIKGSYAALLIGHLITDNEEYEALVRKNLRGNGFKEIVSVLEKYYTFMDLTCSEASAVAHIKSTKKLIDYFKKRDLVYEMNDSDDCALPLNLETHHASTSNANASTNNEVIGNGGDDDNLTMTATRSGTQRVYKSYSQR